MSLFDDKRFQYRDTYLIFFAAAARPAVDAVQAAFRVPGSRFVTSSSRAQGKLLESVSIESPEDNAAMDIAYVEGPEVRQQVKELLAEFRTITLTGDDSKRLGQLRDCDARFDVLLFEQAGGGDELDPGGLLLVIEKLCELTGGIGVDPQSMSLL